MTRVSSSVGAAGAAVSGFAAISTSGASRSLSLVVSNVAGMEAGVLVVNSVLRHVTEAVSSVKEQAEGVVDLASGIAWRDQGDAVVWA